MTYMGNTLWWEKGRELQSFKTRDDNGNNVNTYVYNYNVDGIRVSKTIDGIKHSYTVEGTKILKETWQNKTIVPLYDNEDEVCGITYNGWPYYFVKNLQGDVIALTDHTGTTVAKYSYDAWGVPTVVEDNTDRQVTSVNPFLYRGYYYDWETGLYYLQSRYYDPSTGRFINGDDAQIATLFDEVLLHHLFAYCENDPLNNVDATGCASLKSIVWELSSRLIRAATKLGQYLLKTFGMSKAKYAHKLKYNNANKLMRFVNDNKSKLKKATGVFGKIGTALECLMIVVECYSKLKGNLSRSSFFQLADMLFYALKIALQKGISKLISWVISTFGWLIWWAKYLLELAIEYVIDFIFKKYLSNAATYFANYLDRKRLSIGACFVALFKSFRKCF